jgi:hypothetical protein
MTIVVPHPAAHRGGRRRPPAGGLPSSHPASIGRIPVPLGSGAAEGSSAPWLANPPTCSPKLLAATEAVVANARRAVFVSDPVLGPHLSQIASLLASVVKRHGCLIELALKDALERSDRYLVLRDVAMPITTTTQELVRTGTIAQLATTSVALTGPVAQIVKLDLIVIDRQQNRAVIAEVKRGSGKSEARKRHQIEWVLRCAQVQAIAFLASLNLHVVSARAVLIDVYGRAGYSPDLSVSGSAIDDLFEVPVLPAIEAVTGLLAARLHADVPGLLALALASLEPLPDAASPVSRIASAP